MCPRLRRPAYAVGEVDGGSRTAPSLPNQRYDRPTVARASRKEEHRPSQRPPSGVRPTHAGHRGGPLRYQSPRRLPAHSGHPAASSAHPHPELHLLTPQGGTFRPWSSSTTVNAMTESGVPSSRQDTTPARPLASTARPPRGCASGQSPWRAALGGCLDHLSLLRSANRRPLGRLDPSSGAARTPVAPPARAARGRRGARARIWRSNSPTAPGTWHLGSSPSIPIEVCPLPRRLVVPPGRAGDFVVDRFG